MTAKKATKQQRVRAVRIERSNDELPQTLARKRTLVALESLGVQEEDFVSAYNTVNVGRGRSGGAPTEEQLEAVREFLDSGDIAKLLEGAGLKTPAAALRLVAKVRSES